jgi:hypothetical protein
MEQRKTTVLELEDTNKQALEIVMELLGDDYSEGYIGNYESWGDNTTHYVWHGDKSYGGYSSVDSHKILVTAIKLLRKKLSNNNVTQ